MFVVFFAAKIYTFHEVSKVEFLFVGRETPKSAEEGRHSSLRSDTDNPDWTDSY